MVNSDPREQLLKTGHWREMAVRVSILVVALLWVVLTGLAHGAGGDLLWQLNDPQGGKQEAKGLAVDSLGNIVVTGYRNLAGNTDDDYWTVKFKADGSGIVWRAAYNRSGGSDQATAVVVDSNDDVIVAGFSWNGVNYDIHTVKYDGASGAVKWEATYNGAANGNDLAVGITVDVLNNVYVGGYTQNAAGNEDYLVVKYGPNGANTDGTPLWANTYNGPANGVDKLQAISAGNGCIAVTGQSWNGTDFDIVTIKYDDAGNKMWEKRYSSAGQNADIGKGVRVDNACNVIMTGSVSNGSNLDIYTVKYASTTGDVVWQRTYNNGFDDEPTTIHLDSEENVYIGGYTFTLTGHEDLYVAKYRAADGSLAWETSYDAGTGTSDIMVAIKVDDGGNVFATGYSIKPDATTDIVTIKYSKETGNRLWTAVFNGAAGKSEKPVGIGLGPGGDVKVVGWSDLWTAGATDYDYLVLDYDPGLLNAPTNLAGTALAANSARLSWTDNATNEDGFKIERREGELGSWSEIAQVGANVTTYDDSGLKANTYYFYRVRAYNALNGDSHYSAEARVLTVYVTFAAPVWSYQLNGPDNGEDYPEGIAVGPDGHPVVTGRSFGTVSGFDYLTQKLDKDTMNVLWSFRYDDVDNEDDLGKGVAVDNTNAAIVTGYSSLYYAPAGKNIFSIFTMKIPASGPNPTWEGQYNGPGGIDDRAHAIAAAVDGSNNVAVVGFGKNAAGNDDLYLVKYAASPPLDMYGKAIPAWTATPFDGGGNDYPSALAFDGAGNIVVAGYTYNGGSYDIFTAKYDGATGNRLWTRTYNGAGNGNDYGHALAIDDEGNVYVTGSAVGAAGNDDFVTIKYQGSDGSELWVRTFDGQAHGADQAKAIVYDQIDYTVTVAGTALTVAPDDTDVALVRYTKAGDVVWQQTYLRPGAVDTLNAMAGDRSGNLHLACTTGDGVTTDAMSLKYNYEGALVGATRFNGAANSFDEATVVAVNHLGEAFFAGHTTNAAGNADYLVYKEAGETLQAPSPFTPVSTYTRIDFSWADTSSVEDGFQLERKIGACSADNTHPWSLVYTAPANSTGYANTGLNVGEEYCYRLRAFRNSGEVSRWIERHVVMETPPAPTGVTATPATTTRIDLAWTDNTPNETGTRIYRCEGVGCTDFSELAAVGAGVVSYTDSSVKNNTSYSYKLFVEKSGDWQSPFSAVATAVTPAPVPPVLQSVTALSEGRVKLAWTDGNSDESGYRIERCSGAACTFQAGEGYFAFQVAADTTTVEDAPLVPNSTYRYRVRAFKTATSSWQTPFSADLPVTTLNPSLAAPTATVVNSTAVNLAWSDILTEETNYAVERCAGSGCSSFAEVGVAAPGSAGYGDGAACNGTTYRYRVRGVNRGLSNTAGGGGWAKRLPLTISNFQPSFPIRITVPYDAEMKSDFSDLRFYDEGARTELPYWIESKTDGVSATVIVKSATTGQVYLYFANPAATPASSLAGVFGSGLMAYYPFDEAAGTYSGTTADKSGNGNDLSLVNFYSGYGVVAGGRYGNALRLTGGSYAKRDAPAVPTGGVATVEAWIYPTSYADTTYNGIVSWGTRQCNGLGFALSIQNSGRPSAPSWCNDFVPGSGPTATLNAWNHIAVVANGANATLYLNGQPIGGTFSAGIAPNAASVNLAVGVLDYPGRYFNGYIDEVRIYNRALSQQELAGHYAATLPTVTLGAKESNSYQFSGLYEGDPSPASNEVTTPVPTAPTLTLTPVNETRIDLAWTDTNSDRSGFRVERCSGAACSDFSQVGSDLPANAVSYSDTGLTPNTVYRYRLRTFKTAACGWSAVSTEQTADTNVKAPAALSATAAVTTGCEDIRVTDGDGSALFNHWTQPFQCGTTVTRVWPKITQIPVGTKQIYLYYGSLTAPAADNGSGTFEFFDDFGGTTLDAAKWNVVLGTASDYSLINGHLRVTNTNLRLTSKFNLVPGLLMTMRAKTSAVAANGQVIGGVFSYSSNNLGLAEMPASSGTFLNAGYTARSGAKVPANYIGYTLWATDTSQVTLQAYNWDLGSWVFNPLQIPYDLSNKPIALGRSFYYDSYAGQAYQTDYDWVLVRKAVATAPTAAAGTKEYGSFTVGGNSFAVRLPVTIDNSAGAAALSNYQAVIPTPDTTPLATDRITLGWTDTTSTETGFAIERCSGSGCDFSSKTTFTAAVNATSYTDRTVDAGGITYCYRVKALLPSGDTGYTAVQCATTSTPTAPANLTGVANGTQIVLSWDDPTANEDGFQIERCAGAGCDFSVPDSGFPVVIGPHAGATAGYADNSTCSGTYRYRVKSLKPWVTGWPQGYSNVFDITPNAPPAPETLTATRASEAQITLAWVDRTSDETGFKIERCSGTGCDFSVLDSGFPKTVAADSTGYQDGGLVASTTYRYRVRAYKVAACGWDTDPSNIAEATTTIAAPASLQATAVNTTQVNLGWSAPDTTNESGFTVLRCSGAGCTPTVQVGLTAVDAVGWNDGSVCSNTAYTYRVAAVNTGLSLPMGGDWYKRRPVTITPFAAATEVKLTLAYVAGMNSDFSDIRFYDETAARELPYWIESKSDGVSATVWLKTGANNAIKLYYGNTAAASASSGSATFAFFDGFDDTAINTGTWTVADGSGFSVAGGVLHGTNASGRLVSKATFPVGTVLEVKATTTLRAADGHMTGGFYGGSTSSGIGILAHGTATYYFNNGNWVQGAVGTLPSHAMLYSSAIKSDSTVAVRIDDLDTATTFWNIGDLANSAAGKPIALGRRYDEYGGGESYACDWDWVRVRTYLASPPTVTVGAEETSATPYTQSFPNLYTGPYSSASVTTPAPKTPTGLTATRASETQINLVWSDGNTDRSGFLLERCSGTGCDFSSLDAGFPVTLGSAVTSYSDAGLASNTRYRYRVKAFKTAGCGWTSTPSPVAEADTTLLGPTGLTATALNTTRIRLSWTDRSSSESGFVVERCTGTTASCSAASFAPVGVTAVNATSYTDDAACPSTTYTYRVAPYNRGLSLDGGSAWTRRRPLSIANFQANAMTKVTVAYSAGMNADFSDIRFYDAGYGLELPYWIESKSDGVSATVWIRTPAANSVYLYYGNPAAGSASDPRYVYDLYDDFPGTALDATKWTAVGSYASVANNELTVSGGSGSWWSGLYSVQNFSRPFIFEVEYSYVGANYLMLGVKDANATPGGINYTDFPYAAYATVDGSGSRYQVYEDGSSRGDNLRTFSGGSWQYLRFDVQATGAVYSQGTPTSSSAFYTSGYSSESPLKVGYSNNNQAFKLRNVRVRKVLVPEPTVTLGAEEQSAGFTFSRNFEPTAGLYSGTAQATTATPAAPTSLTATATSDTQLTLAWNDTTADESGFVVEQCTDGSCSATSEIATLGPNSTSYGVTGLTPSTTFCYRVKSIKSAACSSGWGLYSTIACDLTFSQHPDGLTATALNAFTVRLDWSDLSSDESGFELEVQAWNGKWVKIAALLPGSTSYTDTMGLEPLKSYNYRVRAYRGSDFSPYSNTATVTMPAYTAGDATCK